MSGRQRMPSWMLVVVTGLFSVAMLGLERANLFPLLQLAVRWSPSALASTTAAPADEIAAGLPVLSLSFADADLNSPETGLLPNRNKTGPEWERPASLSYFENGRLLFASGVGVRMHGGFSAPRLGFRVYFRRRYGPREFAPGVLFGPDAQPLRRLVVHYDVRRDFDGSVWHFVNPLAYDIAKAMGAITPATKPVRVFVNGNYYGPLVLTERFDERFFAAHWGHDNVVFSQTSLEELWAWVSSTRPLTMERVAEKIDVESLTRWFLAVTFCATRDAYQEPGPFLDRTRSSAGWFFVNWDMDRSFRDWNLDTYRYLLERIREPRTPRRNDAEPRAVLLTNLIAEDARYRDYFKRTFQQVMNHHVTGVFLDERYRHYAELATELEVKERDYLPRLREFFDRRPPFYRLITEQWLNTGPSQPVTLVAPENVSLVIDGERVTGGYRGFYFPDVEMTVDVAPEHAARFLGWRINGQPSAAAPRLSFKAEAPMVIEAVFENAASAGAVPVPEPPDRLRLRPPSGEPPAPGSRPDIAWRRIPAGSFWMGCVPADSRCEAPERPRVRVEIEQPFDMMDREATVEQFQAFATASGVRMPRQPEWHSGDAHPVVNVTWDEAQAFCQAAGGSLPTEQQWEYAARGGLDGRLYPWGDAFRGEANALLTFPAETWNETAPAGSFPPNGFGLYDMSGNVWEWTSSPHRPTHDTGPGTGDYDLRTIKGGSWNSAPAHLRLSDRSALSRLGRHNLYVGFRCVREAAARP